MSRNQKAPLLVFVLVAMICTLVVVDSMRVDAGDRDLVLGARSPGVAGSAVPGPVPSATPDAGDTGDVQGPRGDSDSASPVGGGLAPDATSGSVPVDTGAPAGSPARDDGTASPQLGTGLEPLLTWGSVPADDEPAGPAGGDPEALPESGPPTEGPSTHEGLEPEHGARPDLPDRGLAAVSPPVPVPVPVPVVPAPTSPVPPLTAVPITPGAEPTPAEPLCRKGARRHPARRALQPCR